MNVVVIVLLGLLWASILVPGVLRDRRYRSPHNSIDAFERSMGILANDLRAHRPGGSFESRTGRRVLVVDDPDRFAGRPARLRTVRRRRQVLQALVTVTLLAALAAAVAGQAALPGLVVSVAATLLYLGLVLRVRARESDARRTLRRLPPRELDRRRGHRIASGDAVADSPA